jgi:Ran GTPase-activating protein (RanGAP) involved in mRNA processing and transport
MPVDTHNLSHEERLKTACWRLDVTSMGATDLDCGLAGFNDADIIKLTKILARNPILLDLNLSGNTCGEDGTRGLARALRVNKTLTKLDLHNNLIGDFVLSLVEALRINRTLTTLNLIDNQIGDNGALEIAGALAGRDGDGGWASVSSLRLGLNKWGKMGNAALLRSLAKNTALTRLDLSRCKLNGVKDGPLIASALQVNRSLHTLVLDYNSLGDVGATSIAKVPGDKNTSRK